MLQFSEELERDNYIEAIADKYGMGFENLRKLVYHFGTQGLTGSEPRQKKSREKPQKEDGMKQSQRLLLTWLIEDTRLFELIEEYLGAEDFTDLSPELMKKYKQRFWNIELFIPTPNADADCNQGLTAHTFACNGK